MKQKNQSGQHDPFVNFCVNKGVGKAVTYYMHLKLLPQKGLIDFVESPLSDLVFSPCLFTQAYNQKVNYDILVFSMLPISEEFLKQICEVVAPAKVIVAVDEWTLEEQLHYLSMEQLLRGCGSA